MGRDLGFPGAGGLSAFFKHARAVLVISLTVASGGCGVGSRQSTYAISTDTGEVIVTCEWFAHDGGYWEPTTQDTFAYQWVCDAMPDHGALESVPQTVVNPSNSSEVAHHR